MGTMSDLTNKGTVGFRYYYYSTVILGSIDLSNSYYVGDKMVNQIILPRSTELANNISILLIICISNVCFLAWTTGRLPAHEEESFNLE